MAHRYGMLSLLEAYTGDQVRDSPLLVARIAKTVS